MSKYIKKLEWRLPEKLITKNHKLVDLKLDLKANGFIPQELAKNHVTDGPKITLKTLVSHYYLISSGIVENES